MVFGPCFDSQRALPYGRYEFHRVHVHRNPVLPAHSLKPGSGQDDCVELSFIELSEARFNVSAKIANFEIGAHGPYLGATAKAAGADERSMTKIGDRFALLG